MHRLYMTYNFLSFNQLISFKLCFKQVSYIASNFMKFFCNKPYKLHLIFIIRNARCESIAFLVFNKQHPHHMYTPETCHTQIY